MFMNLRNWLSSNRCLNGMLIGLNVIVGLGDVEIGTKFFPPISINVSDPGR